MSIGPPVALILRQAQDERAMVKVLAKFHFGQEEKAMGVRSTSRPGKAAQSSGCESHPGAVSSGPGIQPCSQSSDRLIDA